VERWDEPAGRRHPLAGLTFALERSGSEVLVCAVDMPFVDAPLLEAVKEAALGDPSARAAVAEAGGRLEPLLAIYRLAALAALRAAADDARLTTVVEALEPVRVPVSVDAVRSVNTPEQLAAAEAELAG
jgi:molybdopterin-guanine dinucleotide biosynthesis protein A